MQRLNFSQTHTIRRIRHHDAFFPIGAHILCITRLKYHPFIYFRHTRILLRRPNHQTVVVAGSNGRGGLVFDLLACCLFEFEPQGFIKLIQLFKTKTAHQTRRTIQCNPRSFNRQSTAATKWVLKGLAAIITC